MAAWLMLGDAPLRFVLDQDLELQAVDQTKATVRYVRHPLEGKEIQQHLNSGKFVTRLGLTWNDRVSFVLTEKLEIKRLQFLTHQERKRRRRFRARARRTIRHRLRADGRRAVATAGRSH